MTTVMEQQRDGHWLLPADVSLCRGCMRFGVTSDDGTVGRHVGTGHCRADGGPFVLPQLELDELIEAEREGDSAVRLRLVARYN